MISASYNRIIDWKLQHPPAHYWHKNLYATFIDDPLGLSLIDLIGVDRALWSLDYPHVESTFGWSRTLIKNIVDQAGEDGGRRNLGGNATASFKLDHSATRNNGQIPTAIATAPRQDIATSSPGSANR